MDLHPVWVLMVDDALKLHLAIKAGQLLKRSIDLDFLILDNISITTTYALGVGLKLNAWHI